MNILKYNTTFKPGKPVDLELEAGQSRNFGAGAVQSLRPEPTQEIWASTRPFFRESAEADE
jgi:hypothetical protein